MKKISPETKSLPTSDDKVITPEKVIIPVTPQLVRHGKLKSFLYRKRVWLIGTIFLIFSLTEPIRCCERGSITPC